MLSAHLQQLITSIRTDTKTFRLLVPTNLIQEKHKFFQDKNYQPQFIYPNFDRERFKKTLSRISDINYSTENFLENWVMKKRIEETILKIKLILSVGNSVAITKISQKLYQCKFDPPTLRQALKDSTIKGFFAAEEVFSPS